MSWRCATSILVLVLAACGSSSAASDGAGGSSGPSFPPGQANCGPHGVQTLAASHQARVYVSGREVFGCARGTGQSYKLGASARSLREARVGPVAVAGTDVGYGSTNFGVDTVNSQVVVRNLGDGRQVHAAPATTTSLPESFQTVDSIVVRSGGAVAWIAEVGSVISHAHEIEVQRVDARGPALLDSGSGIDTRSLRLHGSTLTWRDGSATRTATLR